MTLINIEVRDTRERPAIAKDIGAPGTGIPLISLIKGENMDTRPLMTSVKVKAELIRVWVVSIALTIALGSVSNPLGGITAQHAKSSGETYSSKRMTDGKQWTTYNL